MNIVPIRDLEPRQSGIKIRVRVCRIWRPKIVKSDSKFDGLHCIVVDAMGDAIEASVQEVDYDLVAPKIEAGCLYDITRFNTGIGKSSYQIVPHCAQLKFNARTIFSKLSNVHPAIQRHRFYLLDYNSLSSRIDDVSILTDFLGHICAIQPLQDKILNDGRIEKMCEIYIENLRKKEIKVTLWGDTAASFNFKALEESTTATFVVFTSLKVKDYNGDPVLNSTLSTLTFINPDILELQAYKSMFSDSTNIVKKLPVSTTQQIMSQELQAAKRFTLNELNILDPEKYKDGIIVSKATVVRFDTRNGWWYKACPSCYKQLKTNPHTSHTDQLLCPKHGIIRQIPVAWFKVGLVLEDTTDEANAMIIGRAAEQLFQISCQELVYDKGFVDQQEFPKEILRIKGQCKLFRFRFGTIKNDLLIQGVLDDKAELLESSSKSMEKVTKMLPLTPSPSSKQVPPSSLIASPETPAKITSSAKRKASPAVTKAILNSIKQTRRKLESHYTIEEESATTLIAKDIEEKAEDPDNMPIISYRKKGIPTDFEASSAATTKEMKTSPYDKKEEQ